MCCFSLVMIVFLPQSPAALWTSKPSLLSRARWQAYSGSDWSLQELPHVSRAPETPTKETAVPMLNQRQRQKYTYKMTTRINFTSNKVHYLGIFMKQIGFTWYLSWYVCVLQCNEKAGIRKVCVKVSSELKSEIQSCKNWEKVNGAALPCSWAQGVREWNQIDWLNQKEQITSASRHILPPLLCFWSGGKRDKNKKKFSNKIRIII